MAETEANSVSLAILGSGGTGALTAGGILLEAAGKAGLYGMLTRSVGPQIRGGEAAALVRLARDPVECAAERYDLMIGIDWKNADRLAAEIPLSPEGLIIADPESGPVPEEITASGAPVVEFPLKETAKAIAGGRENMVAAGLAAALTGMDIEAVRQVIRTKLARKGDDAVNSGLACLDAGITGAEKMPRSYRLKATQQADQERWLITGNEAVGLGAVRGGIRFAAAYPITPATEVLEWLAPALARVGGALVQAEDELSSINMAIGASFGGRASMTATSGPGLALMMEALGLSAASETPVVVVDVMRGGPSTGIPTKSEQSDLNIAVYGFHGDAPHVVVGPLGVADCLFTAQWAVHLAEAMQVPAIVLSDQAIGQARAVIDRPADLSFFANRRLWQGGDQDEQEYARYALTADGISPMALPGTPGGQYTADGLTHSVTGTPSSRMSDQKAQMDKRRDKVEQFDYGTHWAEIEGDGDTVILTWGSTTGAAREAAKRLRAAGIDVKLVALRLISPFPAAQLLQAIGDAGRILVVEQTHSGQFARHVRAHCDLPGKVRPFHREGPRLIGPAEIVTEITDWIKS